MTRKSSARVKAIKVDKPETATPELPPIDETFNNAKQAMVNTIDVALLLSKNAKNYGNVRKFVIEFWGREFTESKLPAERMAYLDKMWELSVETYEKVAEIIKGWEMEEFLKEEMKDYFEDIIPAPPFLTEQELFEALLIQDIVEPWGGRMSQLHYQMLDEQKARQPIEA